MSGSGAQRRVKPSRQAFVRATGELLQRQGLGATAVSEIVARSGAPRGSLYFHFPGGKEQLATAAMARSGERLRRSISATLASDDGAGGGVARLVDAMAAGLESSDYAEGCPIATVTLEAATSSEAVRAAAEEAFESWLAVLEEHLARYGAPPATARRRALLILSALEGALILSRARRDTAPLAAVRDELVALAI